MEDAIRARYWCHMCSQMVNPIMEIEMKCPFCQNGFIEEMNGTTRDNQDADSDFGSDRALSLWAPILLGMMNNPRRRRRLRRLDFDEDDDDDNDNDDGETRQGRDTELDRELESIIRRRRRSSASFLQLLQGIRAGLASESENSEGDRDRDRGRERERERERVILINPFNQTIIVQGSYDSNQGQINNHTPISSLGDYFIGPGLDLLLQHLAENDPNRHGTPPAQKEAVEALPAVTIKENMQCSVCLDDFEVGVEAKEMPCKHKFHSGCILPWLELHSSCPVCRFQLPADESKRESDISRNSSNSRESEEIGDVGGGGGGGEEGDGDGRNRNGRRFSIPWPFSSLFSHSGSQSGGSGGNSSSAGANATGSGSASQTEEN
ncbi:E3 ubiquitin-protein ligase SIRP1 [Pyrus x bretschneideri]|uniref:E3 ubiquitin-protein ligase SIRP1 n=1 Tax=Pyrus x bretschneideri TaxID=225117 RepID=UPI00202F8D2E|nr:E3 ubiquitin-protein ligase SIRP1 [Pyrus x bretschneideri]XP_009339206.2 E3 ubiquitin-protein ligase SIRP1 [Pyrus x bretschneideri]XP_009339207.2 E3 ubiquitin-protein ligase SIRP1 [Pyrus x bretschneideri]